MTSYYAVKHMLYPVGADEDTSIFSDCASSLGRFSPRKQGVGVGLGANGASGNNNETTAGCDRSKSKSPKRQTSNFYVHKHRISIDSTQHSREERKSRTANKL